MKSTQISTSACRNCRYFSPEGRRGGVCQQLGAPVRGSWKACSLAASPFAPSWESLEDALSLPDATPVLAKGSDNFAVKNIETPVERISSPVKVEALLS
ncbi:MAG: hypothetical protein HC836_25425 [Richelia sp. RM2_1_2]|nr:hypothetical protein [Richelia sp. SM2_1_7]NJM19330.1 hypothetical protein [Richelia sp. SM1_7_0]NJN09451.1 hypothetical protein [Richelia sp. RM1_1_1]NJO29398.1 hypothetical protein [Richelia sp. SL_2_1]NJO61469.1 hypothetical protein [Richelia sp. RM2_1_2]NJS16069.1 hypothetical protein [Nostocaceae cyanobacterium CSU_2_110]